MSKRYGVTEKYWACGRKRRYSNSSGAHKTKRLLEKQNGHSVSVYRCTYCDGYHIANAVKRGN